MIPLMKSVEDVEKALNSLPFVAKVERVPTARACKKALADLAALGKIDGRKEFQLQQTLEPYLRA